MGGWGEGEGGRVKTTSQKRKKIPREHLDTKSSIVSVCVARTKSKRSLGGVNERYPDPSRVTGEIGAMEEARERGRGREKGERVLCMYSGRGEKKERGGGGRVSRCR